MFVKRDSKLILDETFEESKTIEFHMKGCKESQIYVANRETQQPPKRGILLTRPQGKQTNQNTEKDGADMEIIKERSIIFQIKL
jgi:hypothetical protein